MLQYRCANSIIAVQYSAHTKPVITVQYRCTEPFITHLKEGGSLIGEEVPAVGHEVEHDIVTVLRPLHLVTVLDILHDLKKI